MQNYDTDGFDPEPKRTAISRIIARYPEIGDDELGEVLQYLSNETSGRDIDIVTSDETLRPQYRQLCREHYIGRLRPMEKVQFAIVLIAMVLILVLLRVIARAG